MKKIKFLFYLFVLIFVIAMIAIFIARKPSYTIKTSGKLYIVNKLSRDITVFDLSEGKEITKLPIGIESHGVVTLKKQNKVIFSNYNTTSVKGKSLTVIDAKTNKIDKTIEFDDGLGLDGIVPFLELNKVAVVSRTTNNLFVIDVEKNIVEKKIATLQKTNHNLVLHPNKAIAYVTNTKSGSISVIDLSLNKVIKIIPCGLGAQGIDITPDGSEIWVANTTENSITIINTVSYQSINILRVGNEPVNLKFSKKGKYCLVVNRREGTISIYNQKSKKKIKTIHLHGKTSIVERILYHTPRPVNILMHPNGLYAFISNSNANKVEVIDMKTFTVVSTIGTGEVPDALAFVE